MREVAWAAAPRTDQAYPACPMALTQGWKWSEMTEESKPACSALTTSATRSFGARCSHIIVYPIFAMVLLDSLRLRSTISSETSGNCALSP